MKEFLKVPQPTEMLRMLHKNEVSAEQLEGIYGKRNEKFAGSDHSCKKDATKIEVSKVCKVVFGAFSTSLTSLGLAVVRPLLSMKKLCQSTCAKTVAGQLSNFLICRKMTRACWKALCVCCVSCFKLIPAHTSMHRWCIRFCSGRQEIRCLESCSSRCSKLKQIIFRKNLQSCVQYWQRPPKKRKLPKSKQTVSDKFHWNQRSRNWRLCCWNISMPWSWSAIWVSCVFSVVFRGAKSFCNLSFSQALCSLQTAQSLKCCIFITKGCTGCYVWLVVS